MPSRPLTYLRNLFRRLKRLFSAIALAEKGCFDEVRELLNESNTHQGQSEAVGTQHSQYL